MTASCPRCSASITATRDERGMLTCPKCGARLRAVGASSSAASPDAEALNPAPPIGAALQDLIAEVQALRRGQEQILRSLSALADAPRAPPIEKDPPPSSDPSELSVAATPGFQTPPTPIRSRRRQKSVLVVDDDEVTCREVLAALAAAQVPARSVGNGGAALTTMASDKPDLVVLELGLTGDMVSRDLMNMIKATMEWVHICIVLHTRVAIDDPADVRTIHGADDFVAKAPGSAELLAARVIEIFQGG